MTNDLLCAWISNLLFLDPAVLKPHIEPCELYLFVCFVGAQVLKKRT